MFATPRLEDAPLGPERDERVIMRGLDWSHYEVMLAIRGDRAGIRLAFLEGDLEIMSPGSTHEAVKTASARLLEAYAEETGIYLQRVWLADHEGSCRPPGGRARRVLRRGIAQGPPRPGHRGHPARRRA